MPVILVCPSKAGLYCGLFGAFVSTGDGGAGVLDDWEEVHATKKNVDATAKNIFFIQRLFNVKWYLQEWC